MYLISLTVRQLALNVLGGGFIGYSTPYSLSDHRTWDTENATQCTFTKLPLPTNSRELQETLGCWSR